MRNQLLGVLFLFALLPCLLKAQGGGLDTLLLRLQNAHDPSEQLPTLIAIGQWYDQKGISGKSIEYLQRAYDMGAGKLPHSERMVLLQAIARQYRDIRDYSNAIDAYEQALALSSQHTEQISLLQQLGNMHFLSANMEPALHAYQQLLSFSAEADKPTLARTWLKISQIQQLLGRHQEALSSAQNAVVYSESAELRQKSLLQKAICLVENGKANEGQNLLEQLASIRWGSVKLDAASKLIEIKSRNRKDKAFATQAATVCKQAEEALRTDLLPSLYLILAEIYKAQKNYQSAEYYSQQKNKLESTIKSQERDWQEQFLQREIDAERKENQLKENMARLQQREAMLTQAKFESEKQLNELALKEKAIELLKKEEEYRIGQLAQQLRLAEQRSLAEAQTHQANLLRQEAERQRLLTERLEAEKLIQRQALEAEQAKSAHHQAELSQERLIRQYAFFVIALGTALIALLVWAFYSSQKTKKQLQSKNQEIQMKGEELLSQNEELRQTQEELQTQRDYVELKNKELEKKSYTISSSLNYALTIQQALLPSQEELSKRFAEHFVLYKPKDIVSGDFYWVGGKEQTIIAVIDCTGHGVPGAFMSMIGYTLVNDIVSLEGIASPAAILEQMHHHVRRVLHQDTSHNQDGMDASICTFSTLPSGEIKVACAGARIATLFKTPQGDFHVVEGTRRSIGGDSLAEKAFENTEIMLPPGTIAYFATDGFADQSNPQRRKFGKYNLQESIEELHGTLPEQQRQLEEILKAHQQGEEQRDDITVLGVRLG